MQRRAVLTALSASAIFLIAGCAAPTLATGPNDTKTAVWTGRLALDVADAPSQSFSALFDLRGNADAGELVLTTPIGSTIAALRWEPGAAVLRNGGSERRFGSLDAMLAEATGTPLPVAALFDWLDGRPSPVAGWTPDLAQHDRGRLRATRHTPQPVVELRVAIDRG